MIRVLLLAALYAFNYGGEPVTGLDDAPVVRTVRDDAEAKKVVREWKSADGRLLLRSTETEYRRFPVTEYVPELVCVGETPTGIVDGFRTLSLTRPSARTVLRALHGTVCSDRDFAPETPVLGTGKGETNAFAMVATEGRSSAQWMPWWGVDFAGGDGLEIGLGWTGAWRADFQTDGTNFTMSAGMVKTHFRLLKGETIRQPSLLVFRRAKGVTPRQMQTVIHRFMVDVKSPRDRKGELIHGISAITAGGGNKTPTMMKKIIDWKVANDMPFDCFWVDAGWNGPAHMPDLISNCGNMWYNFTGDWRFNPTVHPDGDLGKVADAAHAADMRMLLWMEPERCVSEPPPPVFREHRDWLLPKLDKDIKNKRQLTVDFGNPAALAWVVETVSEHVRRCKLDVFRQDFNLNTLPLWQANDAEDRQGVTEAKHIMGLWTFWDTLRSRFPHLVVENCASGGRRLDFEAVSRGHSYCRTDYAIFHRDPSQITDVQNVTLNTLAYLPFQGSESTPAVFFDDYGIFSAFASGNVFTPSDWNAGIVKNDFTEEQVKWLRESFATGRRMMPFYEGDFYPLTDSRDEVKPVSAWFAQNKDEMRWCAWQMHRPDLNAGFAIFFRRLNTPGHVFTAELGGIDENARYKVETWHGPTEWMSGKALRRLTVELRQPRSFRLVFYSKATDFVNDGGRLQPSVARAKRPEKIEDMSAYLKWKWRMDVTDPKSGLDHEALKKGLDAVVAEWKAKEPWPVVKARLIDYLVDHTALGFSRFDCFPAIASWNRFDRPASKILGEREREVTKQTAPSWFEPMRKEIFASGGKCYRDYDHSSPDWDVILKLGFPGMKARVDACPDDTPFFRSEKMAAAAIMRFLDRLIAGAEAELVRCGGRTEERFLEREIASLKRLRVGPPVTVFDVMQFVFVDFIVSEYFDRFQVRAFGSIDRLWWPYYERDLREGRTTEAQFREDFRHFIWQFGSIDNYWGHPLCLGGTKADGTTEYNPLSLILLDVADREALPTPKLQLKLAKNTPDAIWDKALRMERRHRSMVLMGEDGMARSMSKLGLSADECRRLIVWGCFEWLPPEGNCTSACNINLAKPVELMLKDAKDGKLPPLATFDDFKREYYRRLGEVTDKTRQMMDYLESGLADINPALVLTLGVGNALEKGVDAFSTGMRYNHTTLSEVAFATAVDSLMAVREIVYERRLHSLKDLGGILAKNWDGQESLRLEMARSHRKWGCGNEETDRLGREVLETFTGRFVGLPNARGGKYVCYGLNARGYLHAGRSMGATPDGRFAGEEASKNMAPAIGGDAEGVTAVLKSWKTTVDPAFFPCGLVFDVMLHASSVQGEKGLKTLRAICEEYFANGGCGLNLNIQSVEELKAAQLHPEQYENLQVRVAGWNIRWNDIPKREQDGFIRRLEAMPQ